MNDALRQLVTSGVFAHAAPPTARLSDTWSGASILGGTITIATVCRDPKGHFSLEDTRSGQFWLANRDQENTRKLHGALTGYFRRAQVSDLFLRTSSGGGPVPAKAATHICEGLLYLVTGIQTYPVSALSLSSWLHKRGYDLPAQMRDRAWHLAVATAIYAAEREQLPTACSNRLEPPSTKIRARIRANSELVR